MNTNVSLQELLDDLPRIEAALNQARKDFLDTDAAYDKRGSALEQTVLAEIENYRKPENKRARIVREGAAALEADIRRFLSLRASLATEMAILLNQLILTVSAFMVEGVKFPVHTPVDRRDPLGQVHAFLKDADKKQATLVLLAAKAALLGMKSVDALNVATNLIKIRQGKLEAYLNEVLTVKVDESLGAVQDIMKAEVREEAYKQIIEAAAKVLGVAVETAVPLVKIATISTELYMNLKKVKDRYHRGEVDDMLDFSEQIHTENEAFDKDLELFRSLSDAIAQEKAA